MKGYYQARGFTRNFKSICFVQNKNRILSKGGTYYRPLFCSYYRPLLNASSRISFSSRSGEINVDSLIPKELKGNERIHYQDEKWCILDIDNVVKVEPNDVIDNEIKNSQEPRKQEIFNREEYHEHQVVIDPDCCPGCGNKFQDEYDTQPGYIPSSLLNKYKEKLEMEQVDVVGSTNSLIFEDTVEKEIQDLMNVDTVSPQKIVKKQDANIIDEWVECDEDYYLNKTEEPYSTPTKKSLENKNDNLTICQRCHKLKYVGSIENNLRPGWSDSPLLTPEVFFDRVSVIRHKRCVVVYMIDIFDFHGSVIQNVKKLVGDNQIIIAANKCDILPQDANYERIKLWIRNEFNQIGFDKIKTADIHLVSSKRKNISPLIKHATSLAHALKTDIYVMGAANVGKSTFINTLLDMGRGKSFEKSNQKQKKSHRRHKMNEQVVTTSPIPGTTLDLIEIDMGKKTSLFDTPGLFFKHALTSKLNHAELKAVLPEKRINLFTLRLEAGESLLLGGLGRIDMIDGRPFMFTLFISNHIKIHKTKTLKVEEFLSKHIGTNLCNPPFTKDRLDELGPMVTKEFEIEGVGWKKSATDLVIAGLGWVSVMGAQSCQVNVSAPEGCLVLDREPMMPHESWCSAATWTGVRAYKRGKFKNKHQPSKKKNKNSNNRNYEDSDNDLMSELKKDFIKQKSNKKNDDHYMDFSDMNFNGKREINKKQKKIVKGSLNEILD